MAKPALGRGLGALLGGSISSKPPGLAPAPIETSESVAAPALSGDGVRRVPLSRVLPCPFQPRKDFPPESIKELADSIQAKGILQPLIVRERDGSFELIAGERRWRAAQSLGLAEVPVIVRSADDRAVLELALIENLQRENLNPMEEAQGYFQLMDQFQLTQEEVSTKVGKGRATVANALRLLKLSPAIQGMIRDARISVGHAKVILGLNGVENQRLAAEKVCRDGMNVRQTEALVARLLERETTGVPKSTPSPSVRDPHVAALENQLRERLGMKVRLRYGQGKGAVEISFFSEAELERLLECLGVSLD